MNQDKTPKSIQDRLAILKSMQSNNNKWAKPTIPDATTPNSYLPYTKTIRDRDHAPVTSQWTNTEDRRNPGSVNKSESPRSTHQPNHNNSARSMFNNTSHQYNNNNNNNQLDSQINHWAKRKQLDRERQARRDQSSRTKSNSKHHIDDMDADSPVMLERPKEKTTKKQSVVEVTPAVREVFIPDMISVANLGRLLGARTRK
jgi:hypothetical protein